jgi:hypothetical protein
VQFFGLPARDARLDALKTALRRHQGAQRRAVRLEIPELLIRRERPIAALEADRDAARQGIGEHHQLLRIAHGQGAHHHVVHEAE